MGNSIETIINGLSIRNLNKLGISDDVYSIMTGGLPNERLCIIKEDLWKVYYSERGHKSALKEFQTESEAYEYF